MTLFDKSHSVHQLLSNVFNTSIYVLIDCVIAGCLRYSLPANRIAGMLNTSEAPVDITCPARRTEIGHEKLSNRHLKRYINIWTDILIYCIYICVRAAVYI